MRKPVVQVDPEHVAEYAARIARKMNIQPQDAEEIANDVLRRVLEEAPKGITNLLGLIREITRNLVVDRLRSAEYSARRRTESLDMTDDDGNPLHALLEDPQTSDDVEVRVDVERALEQIPREAAELLLRHYVRGDTQREIAVALGISQSTVRDRVAEAARQFEAMYVQAA